MNTATKLKNEATKVKAKTQLIEHNINVNKPIFTPMTNEEAQNYLKSLKKQKKMSQYFNKNA